MLTLAAGNTIAAICGTATALTLTLSGMELASNVETYKILSQSQIGTSAGVAYTAPASTEVFVKSIHIANTTGADVTGVKLFKNGTAAANQIIGSLTIPANGWATYTEDGWRIFNGNGEILIAGISSTGGGGGSGSGVTVAAYNFSTTTTDADPGAGNFRYSTASLNTAPAMTIYIDLLDANGNDLTTMLDGLPLSNGRISTLLRIFSSATTQEVGTALLVSRTTAVGYRKLGIEWLNLRDVAAANGTSYTIHFEVKGGSFPAGALNHNFNADSRITGIPGFTPNKTKVKNLTSARAYVTLFTLDAPIFIRQFVGPLVPTTAASTGGDRRLMIYRISDMRADGFAGGTLVYDSGLQAGSLATVGGKTITPTQMTLGPGSYMMVDAIGAFTGTVTCTALNGSWKDGSGIHANAAVWETASEMYIPADLTGSPASPFGSLASLVTTSAALPTTAGADQFDVLTVMRYNNLA